MERLELDNLVIELTRRCNMECEHCLRGDAQSLNMKKEYIDTIFSRVGSIYTLTLSGGEPSIVPNIINQVFASAKRHKVDIGSFYIATNGKEVTKPFLASVMGAYIYCSDNELSCLHWSNDNYHNEPSRLEIEKLKVFGFSAPKYSWDYNPDERSVIAEGRAENWGGNHRVLKESYEIDENRVSEGAVYLNCKGNIVAGCDFSYESQDLDENIICKVEDFSLQKVIDFTDD